MYLEGMNHAKVSRKHVKLFYAEAMVKCVNVDRYLRLIRYTAVPLVSFYESLSVGSY